MSSLVLTLLGGMIAVACSLFLRFLLDAREAMVRAQRADDREREAKSTIALAEAKVGLVEAENKALETDRNNLGVLLSESVARGQGFEKQRDAFRRLLDECSGEIVCDGCKSTLATAARAGKDHFRATCRECLEKEQLRVSIGKCERCGKLHGPLTTCGNSVAIGYNAYGYNAVAFGPSSPPPPPKACGCLGACLCLHPYTGRIKETF